MTFFNGRLIISSNKIIYCGNEYVYFIQLFPYSYVKVPTKAVWAFMTDEERGEYNDIQ